MKDNIIREIRLGNKMTQQKMANELGISIKVYQRWEYNTQNVPVKQLIKILDMVQWEWLEPTKELLSHLYCGKK